MKSLLILAQYVKPPKRFEFWAIIILALCFLTVLLPYAVYSAAQANESYYDTFGLDK